MNKEFIPTRLYVKKHSVTNLRYFGKSITKNIDEYLGSGTYWSNHIKKHSKKHVITEWVSDWFYDINELASFALAFSEIFDIVDSTHWANLTEENGLSGGKMAHYLMEQAGAARSITVNSTEWKETAGKAKKEKNLITRQSDEWRESGGKLSYEKARLSMIETKNSIEWKETAGKEAIKKQKETKYDPAWKETTGKKAINKRLKTISDPTWKEKNTKECPHCSLKMAVGNFVRFHGDKCKKLKVVNE